MAEFQEVMRQARRMCNSTLCCDCDIYRLCGEDSRRCQSFIFNSLQKPTAEEIIMRWAAEHPEPVYPMWCEWLADKGVVDVARMPVDYPGGITGGIITEIKPTGKMYAHIPADIAQKLGIEPKPKRE